LTPLFELIIIITKSNELQVGERSDKAKEIQIEIYTKQQRLSKQPLHFMQLNVIQRGPIQNHQNTHPIFPISKPHTFSRILLPPWENFIDR